MGWHSQKRKKAEDAALLGRIEIRVYRDNSQAVGGESIDLRAHGRLTPAKILEVLQATVHFQAQRFLRAEARRLIISPNSPAAPSLLIPGGRR